MRAMRASSRTDEIDLVCPVGITFLRRNVFSKIVKEHDRATLRGVICGIWNPSHQPDGSAYPNGNNVPPFPDYFTATLKPKIGRMIYLKLTQDERDRWALTKGAQIICEGCQHIVDGKTIVFDITDVEFLT